MATAMDEDLEDELEEKEEKSMMCQPGMHKWKLDQCMVCTVCGDCTGYGASCVSSGRPDRVPGGWEDTQTWSGGDVHFSTCTAFMFID